MSKIKSLLDSRFRLLVSLPKNKLEFASAAIEAGADAIKVHLNCHHFASGTTFGSWAKEQGVILEILALAQAARGGEGIPVGIVSGDTTQPTLEEMFEIVAAGFDFWDLFAAHTPPEWLSLPTGRMVAVDDHWDAQLMGGLHALGVQIVEGSIVPKTAYRTPLNAVDLVNYHRLVRASAPMPVVIPHPEIHPARSGQLSPESRGLRDWSSARWSPGSSQLASTRPA